MNRIIRDMSTRCSLRVGPTSPREGDVETIQRENTRSLSPHTSIPSTCHYEASRHPRPAGLCGMRCSVRLCSPETSGRTASEALRFPRRWTKEDHEIFDLVSALEGSEGKGTTFYSFLGVPPQAQLKDINRQYRKRSLELQYVCRLFIDFRSTQNTTLSARTKTPTSRMFMHDSLAWAQSPKSLGIRRSGLDTMYVQP